MAQWVIFDTFNTHLILWCTQIMGHIFRYIKNKCSKLIQIQNILVQIFSFSFHSFYSHFCGEENLLALLIPSWPSGVSKQTPSNVQKIGFWEVLRGDGQKSNKGIINFLLLLLYFFVKNRDTNMFVTSLQLEKETSWSALSCKILFFALTIVTTSIDFSWVQT